MKPTFLILGVTLLFSYSSFSQTRPTLPAEQQASEMLSRASAKLKEFRTMEVDFTFEMENSQFSLTETMTGKLFSKGDKYRMTMDENVFISDGKTVWNFVADTDEIHINNIENVEGGLTPTALLANFQTEFRSKFIRQETHNGRTVNIIDLIPNTSQSFFKYRIALDTNNMIVYTVAFDRHGGTNTFNINNVRTNHQISDDLFRFNRAEFPSDVEVIDLR